MRTLFTVFFLIFAIDAIAGTCTSISRTNNSANAVLTSTKYNLDHNQAYAAINSFDGGCTASGTLEKDALNTTDFEVPLKAIRQGCNVTWTDANTLSISACMIAVNGAWVKKDTATSLTWGGSSDAEANSTTYYVYVATGSSGSTLNALLKTTAPNGQGYDASGNTVLARIYNDSGGSILRYYIQQWDGREFAETQNNIVVRGLAITPVMYAATINCDAGSSITSQSGLTPTGANWISSIGNIAGGECSLTLDSTTFDDNPYQCSITNINPSVAQMYDTDTMTSTNVQIHCSTDTGGNCTSYDARILCFGVAI